jgi:hypothetical protein
LEKNESLNQEEIFYLEKEYAVLLRAGAEIHETCVRERLNIVKGRIKEIELLCYKNKCENRGRYLFLGRREMR